MELTIRIPSPGACARALRTWGLRVVPALIAVVAITMVLPGTQEAFAANNSIESPDGPDSVGSHTSLELDQFDLPVVSYYDGTNDDLKVMGCGNTECSGFPTIYSPDTGGNVGEFSSLKLDGLYPVISYYDRTNGDLKVMRCDDFYCDGLGESIVTADSGVGNDVGAFTSLELDASGFPVVSYYDVTNGNLKVLHCGNIYCTAGNTIEVPDSGGDVGLYTSLELDASGNPVISYYHLGDGDLKVIHCNDPDCDGAVNGPETVRVPDATGDVGSHNSLELDADGHPVISYWDFTNRDLKVMHCNDPNCDGGNESITSPDTAGDVGSFTSLELDAKGFPVVSYHDFTNDDLKVLHCTDPKCTGGNESIISVDSTGIVGQYTSLELDDDGNPVVSYYDLTNGNLKHLHCFLPTCGSLPDTLTITNTGQYVLPKTCSDVLDGVTLAYMFTICDDDFQGAPATHANCFDGTDSICNDEDPTPGSIRVTLVNYLYEISPSKVPDFHTALTEPQECALNVKCAVEFIYQPTFRPWYPYDFTSPLGGIDGSVTVDEITAIASRFLQSKPLQD